MGLASATTTQSTILSTLSIPTPDPTTGHTRLSSRQTISACRIWGRGETHGMPARAWTLSDSKSRNTTIPLGTLAPAVRPQRAHCIPALPGQCHPRLRLHTTIRTMTHTTAMLQWAWADLKLVWHILVSEPVHGRKRTSHGI